jgi:hypothetical protein
LVFFVECDDAVCAVWRGDSAKELSVAMVEIANSFEGRDSQLVEEKTFCFFLPFFRSESLRCEVGCGCRSGTSRAEVSRKRRFQVQQKGTNDVSSSVDARLAPAQDWRAQSAHRCLRVRASKSERAREREKNNFFSVIIFFPFEFFFSVGDDERFFFAARCGLSLMLSDEHE